MSRMSATFRSIAARRFDFKAGKVFVPLLLPSSMCTRAQSSRLSAPTSYATLSATSDSTSRPPSVVPSPVCIRFSAVCFNDFLTRVWKFCPFERRRGVRRKKRTRTKGGKIEERVGKIEKNFRNSIGSILFLSNLDVYCIRLMISLYTGDIARGLHRIGQTVRAALFRIPFLLDFILYLFLFSSILLPLPVDR